jgi:pimeloyl-ACP methyl ester carboxylesterase
MRLERVFGWTPRPAVFSLLLAAMVVLNGCATPVGVRRMDPPEAHRRLTESVLTDQNLSAPTLQLLNRADLAEKFKDHPAEVISTLHEGMLTAGQRDVIFALAELSFLHATRSEDRSYFLASAVYAYASIFPKNVKDALDPFDPRLRTAVDLYNQGLAEGFTKKETGKVVLESGTYRLPFGELIMHIDPDEFRWGSYRLNDFFAASAFDVRGLRNNYRWPGVGMALVATLEQAEGEPARDFARVPPTLKISTTAFLKLENVEDGLREGRIKGELALYANQETASVNVDGRIAPLEYSPTAALAYTLEGSRVYGLELKGLLSGDLSLFKQTEHFKDNVILMAPYRPGRIPLVLVHGTASSPARWAQLLNEIFNDRELASRYQVWLFTYNTGNPILFTGGILAQGLRNVVQELDPEGKDKALWKMVVIGHSQGGMLTKLIAIDSGDGFWDQSFKASIDRIDISPETRELLRKSLFYEPLPFVRRIVFISTPHHGSFLVGGRVSGLLRRLITLPSTIISPLQDVIEHNPEAVSNRVLKNDFPRSTDNMDPESPFIKTYSSIPIAPGITSHSIIAVKNPEDPKEDWNDGVVSYSSAHIDGVASEFIVHSGHSAQEAPQAIEEVRRILLENLQEP